MGLQLAPKSKTDFAGVPPSLCSPRFTLSVPLSFPARPVSHSLSLSLFPTPFFSTYIDDFASINVHFTRTIIKPGKKVPTAMCCDNQILLSGFDIEQSKGKFVTRTGNENKNVTFPIG